MPGSPTSGDDIDVVLDVLLKGVPGIDAEELDSLLKDLPMPEPVKFLSRKLQRSVSYVI